MTLSYLPDSLLADVSLKATGYDDALPCGQLEQIWRAVGSSHKWVHYFDIYEEKIRRYVGKEIRLLEIGVHKGGSLRMWRRYLGDDSTIVGVDIDPACGIHDDPAGGIHVRVGSQVDSDFMKSVVREFGPFDVVIDDGSHLSSHMVETFGILFEDGLAGGGIYLVEDIHATYWDSYRDAGFAFSDFVRDLIDLMHAQYWRADLSRIFSQDMADQASLVSLPRLGALVDRIDVRDSIVALHKADGLRRPSVNVVL